MKQYDVAIIGGGTAGIFAAYEIHKLHPELNITMLEQVDKINKRACTIIAKKVDHSINCKQCSIMNGL